MNLPLESFEAAVRRRIDQPGLAETLRRATSQATHKRDALVAERADWEALRQRARQIKLHVLANLDRYFEQFVSAAEAAGATVTWADDAAAAQRRVIEVARAVGAQRVAKAKTMTGEEVEINAALAAAGIVPIETDFGEMICQLAGVPPSHVTAPVIDWSIEQIDELLVRAGIASPSTAPLADDAARRARAAELVGAARKALRGRFLSADLGVSGANFAVAESGSLVLVENEGNIRLSTALPRTHVAIVGIDKLIPRLADLGLFLTLLPVSATGQRQTTYVSLLHRPIGRLEIVLLDNGRTRVLADPRQYDLLSCIRCGACMNVCPVYRQVSGHAYGGVYPGPIGAVLQPHLRGVEWYGALPFASSLCGACSETCPVAIPLHERLLEWRQRLAGAGQIGVAKRAALRAWSWWMDHPRVYRALRPPAWLIDALAQLLPVGWRWSQGREMPRAARESFGQWWSRTHGPSAD